MKSEKKLPEVVKENNIVSIGNQSPMKMYELALSHGADIEQLERMLAFQEKYDAIQAKKAYVKAMAEFKKTPPKIFKTKQVGFSSKKAGAGPTNYKHADLGDVTEKINEGLAKVGITSGFTPDQSNNGIKITCTLTHELGHSESIYLFAGADNTGNKNNIQAIGSTMSYLERYTLLAITGLATHDQDDDGHTSQPIKYIDEKQVSQITDMINSIENFSEESFLSWAKIESVEMMPIYDFGKNLNALKVKAEAGKK